MAGKVAPWGLLVGVALVVCLVLIAGCPSGTPTSPPTAGPGPGGAPGKLAGDTGAGGGGDVIKIGAIFSVTGNMAPLGEPEKQAAEMIVEEVNAKGGLLGKQIELIVKDDKSTPDEAVLAAKDLLETQKVVAIIGPSGTPTTMAIKDLCDEAKVPLVSCAAGRTITDPLKPFVFAVPQTDTLAVERILDYLKAQKISKVAVIHVANPFGESGAKQLEAQLPAAGVQIITTEKFGGDDTDMTAQLTNIKSKKPDAVICWGTNPGPAHVTKGMKKLGITVPLIQSHGVANKSFLSLAGEAAEGVMLPAGRLIVWQSIPDDNAQKPVLKAFAEAFKAKYNKDADTFAGHAYDSLSIVLKAIEVEKSTDPVKIRDGIEMTKNFVGTAGVFTYNALDHNGLVKDAFVWVKVEKGAWKLVQ